MEASGKKYGARCYTERQRFLQSQKLCSVSKNALRSKLVQTHTCEHTQMQILYYTKCLLLALHTSYTGEYVTSLTYILFLTPFLSQFLSLFLSFSHTHLFLFSHTKLISQPRGNKPERERCVRNPHLSPPELLT